MHAAELAKSHAATVKVVAELEEQKQHRSSEVAGLKSKCAAAATEATSTKKQHAETVMALEGKLHVAGVEIGALKLQLQQQREQQEAAAGAAAVAPGPLLPSTAGTPSTDALLALQQLAVTAQQLEALKKQRDAESSAASKVLEALKSQHARKTEELEAQSSALRTELDEVRAGGGAEQSVVALREKVSAAESAAAAEIAAARDEVESLRKRCESE